MSYEAWGDNDDGLVERAVKELNLDTRDPFTLLFANACALVDQRDALRAALVRIANCTPPTHPVQIARVALAKGDA